jgi:hypothetical protein
MDSDLPKYYDMLEKTESATTYVNQTLSRKAAQEPESKLVDKKDYEPNPIHSIHKYILSEVLKDCLEQGLLDAGQ